jgi:hypothetical protein
MDDHLAGRRSGSGAAAATMILRDREPRHEQERFATAHTTFGILHTSPINAFAHIACAIARA